MGPPQRLRRQYSRSSSTTSFVPFSSTALAIRSFRKPRLPDKGTRMANGLPELLHHIDECWKGITAVAHGIHDPSVIRLVPFAPAFCLFDRHSSRGTPQPKCYGQPQAIAECKFPILVADRDGRDQACHFVLSACCASIDKARQIEAAGNIESKLIVETSVEVDQQRPAVTKDKLQLKDAVVAYTLTQTQHALGKLRGDFRLFET